jgi:hypothetical protein
MIDNPKFFMGIVENNDDSTSPEPKRGRVQVRIFGVHTQTTAPATDDCVGLPTQDLPWALCLMPNIYGGVAGYGSMPNPQLQKGAWVFGISLDGDAYNELLILGIIAMPFNISDLALNPMETGTNSVMPNLSSMMGYGQKFAQTDSCKQKYYKAIEQIETSGSVTTDAQNAATKTGSFVGAMQLAPKYGQDYVKAAVSAGLDVSQWGIVSTTSNAEIGNLITNNVSFNRALGQGVYDNFLSKYGGDPLLAAMAYNQGAGGASQIMKAIGYYPGMDYDTIADRFYTVVGNGTAGAGPSNKIYLQKFLSIMRKNDTDGCIDKAFSAKYGTQTQGTTTNG